MSGLGEGSVSPVAIVAGTYNGYALLSDDTLKCWGYDQYGQLGDNTSLVDQGTPVLVTSLGANLHSVAVYGGFNLLVFAPN